MVSLSGNSNKGLSGHDFHLSSYGGVPPKFKPRKVSAVRDFPIGCGPNAPKINLGSGEKAEALGQDKAEGDGVDALERKVTSQSAEVVRSLVWPEIDGSLDGLVNMNPQSAELVKSFGGPQTNETLDNLVNKVIDSVGLISGAKAEELSLEVIHTGVESKKGLKNGVMEDLKTVTESEHQAPFKECDEVQGLGLAKSRGEEENGILVDIGAFADSVALLGSDNSIHLSECLVSDSDIIERKTSSLKDKYKKRRVSAIRDFPPFCGWSAPRLTEVDLPRISGTLGDSVVVGATNELVLDGVESGGLLQHGNFELNKSVPKPRRFLKVTETKNKGATCLGGTITQRKNKILKRRFSDDVTDLGGVMVEGKTGLSSLDGDIIERETKKCDSSRHTKGKAAIRKNEIEEKERLVSSGKATSGSKHAIVVRNNKNHIIHNRKQHEGFLEDQTVLNLDASLSLCSPSSSGHGNARSRVKETLNLFRNICQKLLQGEKRELIEGEESRSKKQGKNCKGRVDLLAAKIIKKEGKEVNTGKQIIGAVPGVKVGDIFLYRVELAIVGVHRLYQAGIDYMKHNGKVIAASIVSSGTYNDNTEEADVLIYSGEGGNVVGKNKQPEDQKLERGNLALKNSISTKNQVRVIRGSKETKTSGCFDTRARVAKSYVYDGLYTVEKYWQEIGSHGKMVFMFELRRIPNQRRE